MSGWLQSLEEQVGEGHHRGMHRLRKGCCLSTLQKRSETPRSSSHCPMSLIPWAPSLAVSLTWGAGSQPHPCSGLTSLDSQIPWTAQRGKKIFDFWRQVCRVFVVLHLKLHKELQSNLVFHSTVLHAPTHRQYNTSAELSFLSRYFWRLGKVRETLSSSLSSMYFYTQD